MKAEDPAQGERCITLTIMTQEHRAPARHQRRAQGGRGTYQTTKATGGPHRHRAGLTGRGHNEARTTSIHTWKGGRLGYSRPSLPRIHHSRGTPYQDAPARATSQQNRNTRHEGGRHLTTGQPANRPEHHLCERERVWKEATARRPGADGGRRPPSNHNVAGGRATTTPGTPTDDRERRR